MDIAFEGTLLDEDSRSMIDQSKIGVTRWSVDGALVLENEHMFTGKGSMLSRSQCLRSGSVEVPEARLLPDGRTPKIRSTSGLERLCVLSTHGGAVSSLLYATPPPPSRSGPKAPWWGGGGGGVQGGARGGGREGRLGGGGGWEGQLGGGSQVGQFGVVVGGEGTGSRYLPLPSLWGES